MLTAEYEESWIRCLSLEGFLLSTLFWQICQLWVKYRLDPVNSNTVKIILNKIGIFLQPRNFFFRFHILNFNFYQI